MGRNAIIHINRLIGIFMFPLLNYPYILSSIIIAKGGGGPGLVSYAQDRSFPAPPVF